MSLVTQEVGVFVKRETGKDPVLQIELTTYQDLFAIYHGTATNHTIVKSIILPQKAKTKGDSENEKEYKQDEIIITRNRIKPKYGKFPYNRQNKATVMGLMRFMDRTRKRVIQYDDIFKVVVFEQRGYETAYIFQNEYDKTIEWYEIGTNEME